MSAAPDYYPLAALGREKVLVWLRAYETDVKGYVRVNKRGQRVIMIVSDDGRTMERAPDHIQRDVSLWRPVDPVAWPDPLPAPAVLVAPSDAHAHPARFPPLPAPEQRPRGIRNAPVGAPLLPDKIAYAPPGQITYEECESRLIRTLMTDRALPDTDRNKLKVRSNWPETGYGPGDYPPEIKTRWEPFKQDIADYLTAMGWFARLMGHERRLIRYRARGWGFIRIGEECGGRNDEWARQQYVRAVVRARDIANGLVADNRPSTKPGRTRALAEA